MRTPDAILCADLHLREDQPVCRTDNFWQTQKDKLAQIRSIQESFKPNIPSIICAGDIFHKWKASPRLLNMALENLPNDIIAIPGNHDLPAHNINRLEESGISVLSSADKIVLSSGGSLEHGWGYNIHCFPFGSEFKSIQRKTKSNVAVIHYFTYKGRRPFPGATGGIGTVLKQLKGYDLIVCGDNHQPFTYKHNDTLFVNPGSLTRQTADQINHKPRVYLWYSDRNEVKPVYLDIDRSIVTRTHIEIDKERDRRIDAFVNRLNDDFEVGLSFEHNLKSFLSANSIGRPVYQKVMEAVDGD